MSILENTADIISKHRFNGSDSAEAIDAEERPNAKKNIIQSAFKTVERHFGISQSLKDQVEDEYIDLEFLKNLSEEDDLGLEPTQELEPFEPDQMDGSSSARLLTLANKKNACQSVHSSILQGVDVLKSVAERAAQVTSYLEYLEGEIERLENIETHSQALRTASANLAQEQRDQIAKNSELKQTVVELETQVASTREELEATNIQLTRVVDEKRRHEDTISSKSMLIAKLENDKARMLDQIEDWEREHSDVKRKHYEAVVQIEQLTESIKEKDAKAARKKLLAQETDQLIEELRVELADIRAKFQASSSSNVACKAKLNETMSKYEAVRREHEAKNTLQLKRIAELEAQNQAMMREASINEDLISELNGQLISAGSIPDIEKQTNARKKARASTKSAAGAKKSKGTKCAI
ncbi:hypothetical protein ACFQ14_01725 [Pseudahrensia aquimaris]|uniref:Crescentin n=1 Tax=Pseudahrensia aquimaris TaxID=744461 RepID=A0ABW3FE65_9HYPH